MGIAFAFNPVTRAAQETPGARTETSRPPAALGEYLLLDRIADGGMASVFRGRHRGSGELVALKTVRTANPQEISSLGREIELLRRLRHPGIVRLVTAGMWNDAPWMAMELLDGRTLFDVIRTIWRSSPQDLPRPESRRVVAWRATDCCPSDNVSELPTAASSMGSRADDTSWLSRLDADPALAPPKSRVAAGNLWAVVTVVERLAVVLDHLHRQGLVHCDVKPENVVLARDGRTTLIDFGLTCALRDRETEIDEDPLYMGTVEYAAPEHLCGGPVDARTDTYSLGCMLYELITGRLVFEGLSPGDIVQKHLDECPVAPSELVSGVPWQLEDLVLAMLAKGSRDRPTNVAAVLCKLKSLIPPTD